MKMLLPVLCLLLGLGSFISSAQSAPARKFSDPFERYLKSVGTNHRELSLQRVAAECGVNIAQMKATYAVTPGDEWQPVTNLQKGLKSLDSDFYTTMEVWKSDNRVLAEMWPNSDDVGSEIRVLYCFNKGELQFAEAIQWNEPVVQNANIKPWGYSRRWQRMAQGNIQQIRAVFVDEYERVISKPKLDADDEESLRWSPPMGPLSDLKLPQKMLQ